MVLQAANLAAEFGTFILDGTKFPADSIQDVNLGRFQAKTTIGEHTKDSDDLFSAWIQDNWRGGGQREKAREGSDDDRWYEGTLQTEYPEALSLQFRAYPYTVDGTDRAVPLGDYNDLFYAAFDNSLYEYDPNADIFNLVGAAGDLVGQPTAPAFEHAGMLWIPMSGAGYCTFDGTTITHVTTPEIVSFEIWDGQLHGITRDGLLCIYLDATSTWDIPTSPGKMALPTNVKARLLTVFHNRSGEPALHIVTDRGVWAYQADVPKIFPTGLMFPPHPELGLGAANWRTENLYVSAGVGVYAYNGTGINAVGLDRNEGLPYRYRGSIRALTPGLNGLYALVQGTAADTAESPTALWAEEGMYADDAMEFRNIAAESSIWKLTTGGWHNEWTSGGRTGIATFSALSIAGSRYDHWWGFGDTLYRRKLSPDYHTPEQGARNGVDEFEESGYLLTPKFDAAMRGFTKTASHFEVYLADVLGNRQPTGVVQVSYRTDRNTAWRVLGETDAIGKTVFPFPVGADPEDSEGEMFGWIQFRYDLRQSIKDDAGALIRTLTPVVDSFILKFVKFPLSGRSWTIKVPLKVDQSMWNTSPEALADKLNELVTSGRFVQFVTGNERFRVLVAQAVEGPNMGGQVPYRDMDLLLLHVKVPESGYVDVSG